MNEYELHCAIGDMLAWTLLPPAFFSSIAHGGYKLTKRAAARLKRSYLIPGLPDLHIVYQGKVFYIEVKTQTGYLSNEQKAVHAKLREAGAQVAVARSVPEVEKLLDAWSIPHRAARL